MKKLLTIAVALVMVLALAVPAFAIYGWEAQPATETTLLPGFELTVDQYEFVPATTGFDWANNYYNAWNPTTGVVAGTNVRFVATINAIAKSGIEATIKHDLSTLRLSVSSTNLYIYEATAMRYVKNSTTGVFEMDTAFGNNGPLANLNSKINQAGKFSWTMDDITNSTKAVKVQVMFTAQVRETADATVTASLRCGATGFDDNGKFEFVSGGNTYTVQHTDNYFYVWNNSTPLRVVRFTVDSSNKVTDVHVSLRDLMSNAITQVTALSNAEQAALRDEIYNTYVAIGANYSMNANATATGLSLYYRAYDLWEASILAVGATHIGETQYWSGNTYSYDTLTTAGLEAFTAVVKAIVADTDLTDADMAQPSNADLFQLARTYMLGMTPVGHQNNINTLSNWFGIATANDMYFDYDGIFTPDNVNLYGTAEALELAIINHRMLADGYVYFATASQYRDYGANNVFTTISGTATFAKTNANIYGQIGKVSTSSTVTAPYYRASYNVNTGLLTFGNAGEVLDAGYDMLIDVMGNVPTVVPGPMAKLFPTVVVPGSYPTTTAVETAFAQSVLAFGDQTVTRTNIEVYGAVDAARAVNAGFGVENQYISSGSMYNYLKATFSEIVKVLSFNWDGTTSYMYEDAFIANFAGALSLSSSVVYTAYASQLIVADPNAQPPQTGDASSILGFVMIALAVVAAGVVTIKKVRA